MPKFNVDCNYYVTYYRVNIQIVIYEWVLIRVWGEICSFLLVVLHLYIPFFITGGNDTEDFYKFHLEAKNNLYQYRPYALMSSRCHVGGSLWSAAGTSLTTAFTRNPISPEWGPMQWDYDIICIRSILFEITHQELYSINNPSTKLSSLT